MTASSPEHHGAPATAAVDGDPRGYDQEHPERGDALNEGYRLP
ncbi:hypothetical protein [Streptomyces pratensis]